MPKSNKIEIEPEISELRDEDDETLAAIDEGVRDAEPPFGTHLTKNGRPSLENEATRFPNQSRQWERVAIPPKRDGLRAESSLL